MSDRRRLALTLTTVLAFLAAALVVAVAAGSLALLAAAACLLTAACRPAFALVAGRRTARPVEARRMAGRGRFTFGLERTSILVAQANGITLLVLAVWIGWTAVRRLTHPGTGAVGLVRADAIAALLVAALMVYAGARLLREAGRIFLEVAPRGVNPATLGRELAAVAGVVELHDLHVWQVTTGYPALSAHVLVAPGGDCHAVRRDLESRLRTGYAIAHSTLQVDHTVPGVAQHCAEAHGTSYRPDPAGTG